MLTFEQHTVSTPESFKIPKNLENSVIKQAEQTNGPGQLWKSGTDIFGLQWLDEGSPDVFRLQVAGSVGEFFQIYCTCDSQWEYVLGKTVRLAY